MCGVLESLSLLEFVYSISIKFNNINDKKDL